MGPDLASCADGCIPELMCIGTGLVSAGSSALVQLISPFLELSHAIWTCLMERQEGIF